MKTLLSISILLISLQISNAQLQSQAVAEGETLERVPMDNTEESVNELRTLVLTKLKLPSDARTGQTVVDVKIDADGKIVDHHVVKSLGYAMDKSIAKALKEVSRITPIIVDDQAEQKVVRLPINIED